MSHVETMIANSIDVEFASSLPGQNEMEIIEYEVHQAVEPTAKLSDVKEMAGDDFSYEEIRIVKAHIAHSNGEAQ